MNLLLLFDEDFQADGTAVLTGRRALHAHDVLNAQPKDALRVGLFNGGVGRAQVLEATKERLCLKTELLEAPPPKTGFDLILAVPRPKALKKVLAAVASLGVERLVLVNAARVEKSYFDSKVLSEAMVKEHFVAGLEQAQDTVPPTLVIRERFRPFVEDELPGLFPGKLKALAHPVGNRPATSLRFSNPDERAVLAIGPEGGWVPFEISLLEQQGFVPFSLGPRTLRVEVAVPYALGQLACVRALSNGAPRDA